MREKSGDHCGSVTLYLEAVSQSLILPEFQMFRLTGFEPIAESRICVAMLLQFCCKSVAKVLQKRCKSVAKTLQKRCKHVATNCNSQKSCFFIKKH